MGKAQSKRSLDITTNKKNAEIVEEGAGEVKKIENVDEMQSQNHGDTSLNEEENKDKSESCETENEKDLFTEKENQEKKENENTFQTSGDQKPKEASVTNKSNDYLEQSAKKDEEITNDNQTNENTTVQASDNKILKKEKSKKKWSFRNISFGKKDKQKPGKKDDVTNVIENEDKNINGDSPLVNATEVTSNNDATSNVESIICNFDKIKTETCNEKSNIKLDENTPKVENLDIKTTTANNHVEISEISETKTYDDNILTDNKDLKSKSEINEENVEDLKLNQSEQFTKVEYEHGESTLEAEKSNRSSTMENRSNDATTSNEESNILNSNKIRIENCNEKSNIKFVENISEINNLDIKTNDANNKVEDNLADENIADNSLNIKTSITNKSETPICNGDKKDLIFTNEISKEIVEGFKSEHSPKVENMDGDASLEAEEKNASIAIEKTSIDLTTSLEGAPNLHSSVEIEKVLYEEKSCDNIPEINNLGTETFNQINNTDILEKEIKFESIHKICNTDKTDLISINAVGEQTIEDLKLNQSEQSPKLKENGIEDHTSELIEFKINKIVNSDNEKFFEDVTSEHHTVDHSFEGDIHLIQDSVGLLEE